MIIIENIPSELKTLRQWVAWAKNHPKFKDKEPINVRIEGRAMSNNPDTWNTFENAIEYIKMRPEITGGIGFVFSKDDPYCGIDLDHCLREDGTPFDWALSVPGQFKGAYIETSPGGDGLHIWIKAEIPTELRKVVNQINLKLKGYEVYDQGRYFTVTGKVWRNGDSE